MLHLLRKKIDLVLIKIFFISCLLTSSFSSIAQIKDLNQTDHDYKPYYFGITLGINSPRFQIEHHERFLAYDSVLVAESNANGGFSLGLLATQRLNERFELRFNPQLMFIERTINYQLRYPDLDGMDVNKKVESIIVTLPIQVKFRSDRIGNFRVYMLAGVKGDIDMASNASSRKADDLLKIKKNDMGVELGMGFNFYFPSFILSPEIKIGNGLKNIHSRDENLKYSSVLDRILSKVVTFSIHLEG